MDVGKDIESNMKTLTQRLTFRPKQVWDEISPKAKKEALAIAERYKQFLYEAKTEREVVSRIQAVSEAEGFREGIEPEKGPRPVMKICAPNRLAHSARQVLVQLRRGQSNGGRDGLLPCELAELRPLWVLYA